MDAPTLPTKGRSKGLWLLFVVIVVLAALVAFLLPKKKVESTKAAIPTAQPGPSIQRAQADAYKSPASR